MRDIDRWRAILFVDKLADSGLADETSEQIREFLATEHIYLAATREIITKLENLNDEFKFSRDHNPIHHLTGRVKTPRRTLEKLKRRGLELSVPSAREHIRDLAGVRVICSYIDDIYLVARMLTSQSDVHIVRTIDYIANPKPNGYRSLHLIVTVPVFLADSVESVQVEVQIRTIAMDFWATLEHELAYSPKERKTEAILRELKDCADVIAETDARMQKLYNIVNPS